MGCTTPDLCADRDDHGGINDRGYDRVRSCDTICDAVSYTHLIEELKKYRENVM